MREIKIQVWDETRNQMWKDDELEAAFTVDILFASFSSGKLIIGTYDASGDWHELKVRQYTGLKDKNGQEIFEGDIVKISDHPFEGPITVNGNYEVGYNSEMELCCGSWLLFRMRHYAEVVGNIYENPELLEKQSD